MNIPCYGVNSLNMGQVNFLSRVDGQDEFLLLIMTFVLGPVTHCCRILNNIPRYVPMAQSLEFIASRGPDQKAAVEWDVLRIVSYPCNNSFPTPVSTLSSYGHSLPLRMARDLFRSFVFHRGNLTWRICVPLQCPKT